MIGLGVVLAVAAIVGFVAWRHTEKETASGEALSNAAADQMVAGPAGQAGAANVYLKVAEKYPGSAAGARALLMAGGSLFEEGKYDQAKSLFERFPREYSDSPLTGEALLGIAACLEAQGKIPEATTAYKTLYERHPNDSVVPQANQGLFLVRFIPRPKLV